MAFSGIFQKDIPHSQLFHIIISCDGLLYCNTTPLLKNNSMLHQQPIQNQFKNWSDCFWSMAQSSKNLNLQKNFVTSLSQI